MGLSCGVICVILCLAVLIQYWSVTDRQTDRHTTTAYTALSIASCGKNELQNHGLAVCINSGDDGATSPKNLVNFCLVTLEVTGLICVCLVRHGQTLAYIVEYLQMCLTDFRNLFTI